LWWCKHASTCPNSGLYKEFHNKCKISNESINPKIKSSKKFEKEFENKLLIIKLGIIYKLLEGREEREGGEGGSSKKRSKKDQKKLNKKFKKEFTNCWKGGRVERGKEGR
jgi:hypothetical protein